GVLHAPKVFISYSHADKAIVLDLYHQLKGKNVNIWLDQFELSPGVLFQKEIEQSLRTSDAMLMVLSRNSNSSKWVPFEGAFFSGQNKLIIPVVLDEEGKSMASELPFLQGRFYADLSNAEARKKSVAKLSSTLSELQRR
ncbi:MAG TPA: toll/interleukin-1 receptor domain-containing protein, partial [Methylocella sp.]|nr:toll/interleukin-1 receptor domain-containing protein [Methylocella sp.]